MVRRTAVKNLRGGVRAVLKLVKSEESSWREGTGLISYIQRIEIRLLDRRF